MQLKNIPANTTELLYEYALKPTLFKFDPENVHELFSDIGIFSSKHDSIKFLLNKSFNYKNPLLKTKVDGIEFNNPIGLAAGFDYDGKISGVWEHLGFGFNTIGTVTYIPYEGNTKPRLVRLPKSNSILVNKGFKSQGAKAVLKRIKEYNLNNTFGISIGSSNVPQISNINLAIEDYINCFSVFNKNCNNKYFELNISCPNTTLTESFTTTSNYKELIKQIKTLNINVPIFIKMPSEVSFENASEIVKTSLDFGIDTFIFSNLAKNRSNKAINEQELEKIKNYKGNFSGKVAQENSLAAIKYFRDNFSNINIIACGGVFNAQDALIRLSLGANLIQLVTGLIYGGPQIANTINRGIIKNRKI